MKKTEATAGMTMGNTKAPRFIFTELCNEREKIEEVAKNYDFGIIDHCWYNKGNSFTASFPVLNGKYRSAYQGEHEDWRVEKIFEVLKKEFKKDPHIVFNNVEGNKLPPLVKAMMFVADPIECVRLGYIPVARNIEFHSLPNEIWVDECNWPCGYASSLIQINGSMIDKGSNDAMVLIENYKMDKKRLGLACLLAAIKLSKKRKVENVIPISTDEEWTIIQQEADSVIEKMKLSRRAWYYCKSLLDGDGYIERLSCPKDIEELLEKNNVLS